MHQPRRPRFALRAPSGAAFAALLTANVALAFGPWFVRLADVGPVAAGFWRLALGAPMLAGMALVGGARPVRLEARLWWVVIAAGICFALDIGFWHLGILRTKLANATLFGNCATLIFPVWGFAVARTWPTRRQGGALTLAALGAALLMGRSYQLDPRNLAGDLLCVAAGVLYTGYFILMVQARAVMAPLAALTLSTLAGVAPIWFFAWMIGERIVPQHWGPLVALALAAQVIGQGLMTYALGRFSPLVVGIALLVQPVVAALIGWLVYREALGAPDLVGAVMVAVALVLVRERAPVASDAREAR